MRRATGLLAFLLAYGMTVECLAQEEAQNPAKAGLTVVVAQDGSGDIRGKSEREIAEAIQRVVKAGGGAVQIKEGTYTINDPIKLGPDAKDIRIEGIGIPVLKLAPQVRTVTTAEAKPGESALQVKDGSPFRPGMLLEIQAPGAAWDREQGRGQCDHQRQGTDEKVVPLTRLPKQACVKR